MRPRLVATVLVISLALSGCSLAFVHGPPKEAAEMMPVDCTTARTWPIVDVLFTLQFGFGALGATVDKSQKRLTPIAMLAIALGFAASSVTGFYRVTKCRGVVD